MHKRTDGISADSRAGFNGAGCQADERMEEGAGMITFQSTCNKSMQSVAQEWQGSVVGMRIRKQKFLK